MRRRIVILAFVLQAGAIVAWPDANAGGRESLRRLVAGVDLKPRPLGYEGKTAGNPIQTVQINSKKLL
jgi:hypothetical protein